MACLCAADQLIRPNLMILTTVAFIRAECCACGAVHNIIGDLNRPITWCLATNIATRTISHSALAIWASGIWTELPADLLW